MVELTINDKKKIIEKVVFLLKSQIQNLKERAEEVKAAAIQAPGRMIARYDSSKEELSYLHDGLTKMILEREQVLSNIKNINIQRNNKVELGSLFWTENGKYFLVLSGAGGEKINYKNIIVSVITPRVPLLINSLKKKEEELEVDREKIFLKEGDFIVWPDGKEEEILKII